MRRLLPLFLVLAGCDFYFGGDGDDVCSSNGTEPSGGAWSSVRLRDPQTGQCTDYGYGGDDCDSTCGPCPEVDLAPLPPYGACESTCTGLDEQACLDTAGCHASYDEDGSIQDAPAYQVFSGCWAVAPGPLPDTQCWDRDAWGCASDDTCAAYFTKGAYNGSLQFARCAPEPVANGCDDVDCGFGSHCELQCAPCAGPDAMCPCAPTCVPDYNACAAVDCAPGYTCVETCSGTSPTESGTMSPWKCEATCVPTGVGDPGACTGDVYCNAIAPACPVGTVAGIANGCWTGYCIPEAACNPADPGGCEPAACDAEGPACPAGTVGGTRNGCWTGYCIPASACPAAACEQLTSELACSARSDCQPVYTGNNCTCDPACGCEELVFDHCSSGSMPLPL
ncbi:MAG: hypothetical protein SFX73_04065 [Kofleriaceae bacterium]|nr:hypothetical protein [Kofleriaceae bacterium]